MNEQKIHPAHEVVKKHFPDNEFDERRQDHILDRMSRLVTSEEVITAEASSSEAKTEYLYSSDQVKLHLEHIARYLAEAHSGQKEDIAVWQDAINNAITSSSTEESKQAGLIMSALSGVKLDTEQTLLTLKANLECQGLAALNPENETYIPVSTNQNVIAAKLIDSGDGSAVARNLDKFEGLNHQEIAAKLIDSGDGSAVARNLDNFEGLNQEIATKLINSGVGWAIAENLDNFEGLNHQEIATRLIEAGFELTIVSNLDKFDNSADILLSLVEKMKINDDLSDAVIENLHRVSLGQDQLMSVLQDCAKQYSTGQKIKQLDFDSLGVAQADKEQLLEDITKLKPELKGISKNNPYEGLNSSIENVTMTQPHTQLHKQATEIARRIRQAEQVESDATNIYSKIADTINVSWEKFKQELNQDKGQNYQQSVLGREHTIASMFPLYRRLAAEYVALTIGDVDSIEKLHDIDQIRITDKIKQAFQKASREYINVLNVDIPYYDKLFLEWDSKRMGEQEFTEVFLGRDGIYAYIARRAQLYARRQRINVPNPQLDMPTYLVYPRAFRDNLDTPEKQVYLNQHITNPKSASYFDTGFIGTIPQDIMRVLGISEEEWDNHIRLLSATRRDRTVIGIENSEKIRHQIVDTVEYNVKPEDTAEGLFDDGEGNLDHYARPTSPNQRLAFAMVQQALHRHYYRQELEALNSEEEKTYLPSHSLEKAGELRTSSELTDEQIEKLKNIFNKEDIGQYLLENAKAIKLSDPSDPYPDEAIFEITIDDREAIIKTVIKSKQQGPLDEFEALLLLRRLGVDSPIPLAKMFTKGSDFIVMDKLPGVSGRTITKYIEENNLTQEEIDILLNQALSIMQGIADTVRRDIGLDKPWKLKDFMIVFDKKGNIEKMLPLDFERAKIFDPEKPHSIKLGQGLDPQ